MKATVLQSILVPLVVAALVYGGRVDATSVDAIVRLDSSSLAGPFSLAFVLTDGSGVGNVSTHATFSAFDFNGGNAGMVDTASSTGASRGA